MKKSILALLLAVLMVASLLPAAALADEPEMSVEDLRNALNAAATSGGTVTMTGNVTVTDEGLSGYGAAAIVVPAGVTLDGAGFSISAGTWNSSNQFHIVGVSGTAANSVTTIKDLTIVGNANTKSGIHAYMCEGEVRLDTVTINNCGNAGMIVNGSLVKATNLTTSGNAWGAVNVDKGSNVTTDATFELVSGNLTENTKIWSEKTSNSTITVPETWAKVNGSSVDNYAPEDSLGDEVVYNETQKEYYLTLAYAIDQATAGDELTLMGDVSVTSTITIDKSLTIDGNNNTITGNVDSDDNIQITAGDFKIMNAAVKDFGGNLGTTSAWGLFKVPYNADPKVSFTAYNLSVSNFNRGAFDINAGTFNIEECEIDCANNSPEGKKLTKALLAGYNAKGTIKNCYIENASSDYTQWAAGGIEVLDDAAVTVDGCTLENVQYGIYPYIYGAEYGLNASVIVKNTNIDASEYAICVGTSDSKGKASVTVQSGNFKGGVTCVGEDGATTGLKITVNGGTFNTSVAQYVGNGLNYEVKSTDGSYNYYPTLADAVANAGPGAEIKNVTDAPDATMYSLVVDPANGGKVISIYVSAGTQYPLYTPNKSGYAFLGWNGSDGKTYAGTDTITVNSNLILTASWVRHPDTEYVPEPEQPVEPETPAFPFYDVPTSAWYYTAVKYVYENKLMDGVDTYVFAPNDTLTRAMVWTIIARMSGVDTTGGNSWYAKAQEWAITNGISDGENPTAAITRQELVTMLYRYAQIKGYDVSVGEDTNILSYVDATSISEYAMSAFQWACGSGLTEGDENGALTPLATATRAQAAAMIMRFLSK